MLIGKWMVTVDRPKNDNMEKLIQDVVKGRFSVTETGTPTTLLVEVDRKARALRRIIKSHLEKDNRRGIYGHATIAEA